MKAARMHKFGEPLHLDNVPVPNPRPDEVLVRVHASGICHSDLNYRDGVAAVSRLPMTLGHEISGVVDKKGARADVVNVGDRVVIHYVVSCGKCGFCRSNRETYCASYEMIGKDLDGGFAEYIRVPIANALKIPESLSLDQAAIMGCAVSTAFHALNRARAEPESSILIFGVGGLGAHAIQLAATVFKARKIIAVDIAQSKLELAKEFGATSVVNPATENLVESVASVTDGVGTDVAIDFVGHSATIESAIACVSKGARVVIVGISSDKLQISPYSTVIGKEIEIVGVNDHLRSELEQLIEHVSSGTLDLSRSVTHKVSLDEVNHGMEILVKGIGNPLRVVVKQ